MITPGPGVDQWKTRAETNFHGDNNNKGLERKPDSNGERHELCQVTISCLTWPSSTCSDVKRQVNRAMSQRAAELS